MYVKITNGSAEKVTVAQLRADNPTVSFPHPLPDAIAAEWGLYPLTSTEPPDHDRLTQAVVEDVPVHIDGIWVQAWQVVPLAQDEAEHRTRRERDRRLADCDWVVIRAKELGQSVPGHWYSYRGDLRQVPEQPGFPYEVVWPVVPE